MPGRIPMNASIGSGFARRSLVRSAALRSEARDDVGDSLRCQRRRIWGGCGRGASARHSTSQAQSALAPPRVCPHWNPFGDVYAATCWRTPCCQNDPGTLGRGVAIATAQAESRCAIGVFHGRVSARCRRIESIAGSIGIDALRRESRFSSAVSIARLSLSDRTVDGLMRVRSVVFHDHRLLPHEPGFQGAMDLIRIRLGAAVGIGHVGLDAGDCARRNARALLSRRSQMRCHAHVERPTHALGAHSGFHISTGSPWQILL